MLETPTGFGICSLRTNDVYIDKCIYKPVHLSRRGVAHSTDEKWTPVNVSRRGVAHSTDEKWTPVNLSRRGACSAQN